MTLKRAFLIILLAFVWLIIFATLGGVLERLSGSQAFSGIIFPLALGGFVILILWGFAVWAGAKGYSPWLGVVLAWNARTGVFNGPIGRKDRATNDCGGIVRVGQAMLAPGIGACEC
jgi:hypothetical protein